MCFREVMTDPEFFKFRGKLFNYYGVEGIAYFEQNWTQFEPGDFIDITKLYLGFGKTSLHEANIESST